MMNVSSQNEGNAINVAPSNYLMIKRKYLEGIDGCPVLKVSVKILKRVWDGASSGTQIIPSIAFSVFFLVMSQRTSA
jgi:hypothetical protein